MAKAQKSLTIAAASWGAAVVEWLAPCFTVPGALALVAEQVESGLAQVFTLDYHGEIVGAFVLRVDGREGVVMAAAGRLDGADLTPVMLPHIEGRFMGCESIRFHTARPGLARMVARHGYRGQEVILRKEL